jgi:hypothetical protein
MMRDRKMMELRIVSIIFKILTIIGAGYVIYTDGKANAGYAVIPLILSFVFQWWGRSAQKKRSNSNLNSVIGSK